MAARSAKRYYFVQISEERFFNNVRIKALEKDGADLVLSFQRLILEALKENDPGFVRLDPAFDSMPEQIATMISCDMDHAERLYDAMIKRRLCKVTDYGLWIPLSKELTASRTEKADEVKKRREAVRKEEALKKAEAAREDEEDLAESESEDDDDDETDHDGGTKEEESSPYKRTKEIKKAIDQRKEVKKTEDQRKEVKKTEDQRKEVKKTEEKRKETKSQEKKIAEKKESKKTEPRRKEKREEEKTNVSPIKRESNRPLPCSVKTSSQSVRRETNKADSEEPADLHSFCSKVYSHLKEKIGFEFYHTESNDAVIAERRAEGFKLKDFLKIIDLKCSQWLHNAKMRPYLRISTLFGPKMDNYRYEVYCNQKPSYDGRCDLGNGYYLKNPIMNKPSEEMMSDDYDPFANASDFVKRARQIELGLCAS